MQTNKTLRTNTTKVFDCVQWQLQRISVANGFYTDHVCVDRSRDPRVLYQDKATEYRKYGALVRIKKADARLDSRTLGGTKRKHQHFELYCLQNLATEQDRAGITLDQIQDWLRHDIEWLLTIDDTFNCIMQAAEALNAADGTWGPAPSCFALQMDADLAGPMQFFPVCSQVLQFSYYYDESEPRGRPGVAV